jgi:hypothetical protein
MTTTTIITTLLLAVSELAQPSSSAGFIFEVSNYSGELHVSDNEGYCYVNGEFSGLVITSVSSVQSANSESRPSF